MPELLDFSSEATEAPLDFSSEAQPAEAPPSGFFDTIGRSLRRGRTVGQQANLVFGEPAAGIDAAELARLERQKTELAPSPEYAAFGSADSFTGAIGQLARHPSILPELVAESLASYFTTGIRKIPAAMAVGAVGGAAAGAPFAGVGALPGAVLGLKAGLIGGTGLTSLALESTGKFLETLQEQGVDTKDEEQLKAAFADPDLVDRAKTAGLKKGIPIAVFDALSAGLAGRFVTAPLKSIGRKVAAGAAELGAQAALGAGGELAGQLVAGEQIQPGAILAEAIGEVAGAPVEVASNLASSGLSRLKSRPIERAGSALERAIARQQGELSMLPVEEPRLPDIQPPETYAQREITEAGRLPDEQKIPTVEAPAVPPEIRTAQRPGQGEEVVPAELQPQVTEPQPKGILQLQADLYREIGRSLNDYVISQPPEQSGLGARAAAVTESVSGSGQAKISRAETPTETVPPEAQARLRGQTEAVAEGKWQALMRSGPHEAAVRVAEMSREETQASLDRLNAAPGDNPVVRSALETKLGEPTPPKDRVETFLDNLKSGVNPKAGDLGTANIIPRIWDALIEQIRLAYQGGKALAAAIDDGIAWLKRTHPEQRFDENELRLELRAEVAGVGGPPGPTTSVPLMITRAMEAQLKERGYSQAQIDAMRPEQANQILTNERIPTEASAEATPVASPTGTEPRTVEETPPPAGNLPRGAAAPGQPTLPFEPPPAASRPPPDASPERIVTQALGHPDMVLDRAKSTATSRAFAFNRTREILEEAGLRPEKRGEGWWGFADETTPQEVAGHKLYDVVAKAFGEENQETLGMLVNAVRSATRRMDIAEANGERVAFSRPLRQDLYAITQGYASGLGTGLRALRNDLAALSYVAQNVDTELRSVWFNSFGGQEVRDILRRIQDAMRGFFTPQEIADALAGRTSFEDLFNGLTPKTTARPPEAAPPPTAPPGSGPPPVAVPPAPTAPVPSPKLSDLVREVFETPFYRQEEIVQRFVDLVQAKFDLTKEQERQLRDEFVATFIGRLEKARASALVKAQEALTPKERATFGKGRPLWKKIVEAANAGVFDPAEIVQKLAKERHWVIPTPAQLLHMRDLAGREQRLRELTKMEREKIGDDPAALANATERKAANFRHQRADLMREMATLWDRWTEPINLRKHWSNPEITYANARAMNEMVSANLLLKPGFGFRQIIDVASQGAFYTPTRAIAHALERHIDDRNSGRPTRLLQHMGEAIAEAYKERVRSWRAGLSAGRTAATGKGQLSDMLQPDAARNKTAIAVFDRAMLRAEELARNGDHTRAFMVRLFTFMRFGYRFAQVLDAVQGTGIEYQEIRLRTVTALLATGKRRAEAVAQADALIGDVRAEQALAVAKAQEWFDGASIKPTPAQLEESAWQIVKSQVYTRLKILAQPNENWQEINENLRQTAGWNNREEGGPGSVIGNIFRGVQDAFAKAGVPFPTASFGNAMSISANRKLVGLGLALIPGKFGEALFAKSPWFATGTDRLQRKVESAIGATMLPILVSLASTGAIVVRLRWPSDEEERQRWILEGRKPGTVEFPSGDGKFYPVSLTTGPLAFFSPELALGGAIHDLAVKQEQKQQKLNKEAAEKGLIPGKAKPPTAGEFLGVGMSALFNAIAGGRTAAGLIGSYTDYGVPDAKKFGAAFLSPLIPGIPAWQEVMRMAGVYLNPKMASLTDLIVPWPTSGARRVNALGDYVGTPSAIQNIIQTLSGGTYPAAVDPKAVQQSKPYQNLFAADWFPPAIQPGRAYNFSGTLRPMTDNELVRYTVARGTRLKAELAGLDVSGLSQDDATKIVQDAYVRANDTALQDVNAVRATKETTGAGGGGAGSSAPTAVRVGRTGGVRAPGPSVGPQLSTPRGTGFAFGPRIRNGLRRATVRLPSIRRGRRLRSRTVRARGLRSRRGFARLSRPRLRRAA